METKFFKKLLILTLLIYPLAVQAFGKRASGNISGGQEEANKKNKGQFVCAECGKSLASEIDLKEHKANHESKRTGKYRFNCDGCNYRTNKSSNISRHQKTPKHKKNIALSGIATTTNTIINPKGPTYLELIASVENSEDNLVTAQAAGKRGADNISGEQKQQKVNKKAKKRHICNECGKSYDYPGNLKMHQKDHESKRTGMWEFNCSVCKYKTNVEKNLIGHEQSEKHKKYMVRTTADNHVSKRAGKYKFNCDVEDCNFKTNELGYFQNHAMDHVSERTGEYKFNCLPCDYKTNRSSHFKVHEQGEKHKKK